MTVALYTHQDMLDHCPGDGHAERPERLRAVTDALADSTLDLTPFDAPLVTNADLLRVHQTDYLSAIFGNAPTQGLLVLDPMKGTTGHMQHTYANGGKYWNDELTKITWNAPEGVEAMEFLLKFVKAQVPKYEDLAIASEAGRKDVIQITDWAPEKFITMINGSWGFFNMKQQAAHIDYSVFPFPRNASNANSKGFTANGGGWMFSRTFTKRTSHCSKRCRSGSGGGRSG